MSEGYDCIIIDTAGRQVIDERLMDELKQIKTAILPDETLLVVDAMTGQEAATLTAKFNDDIGITGAILTKMDGDTRGGSALSVRGVSGKPIKFVGVGENMDDLEPFYPERMASRILGMGDIATLLEKTKDVIDIEGANMLGRKMQKGNFDFNDFMLQTQGTHSLTHSLTHALTHSLTYVLNIGLKKMGGMAGVLKMLPGAAGRITDEAIFETEKRIKRSETIILSMTDEERTNTDLLTLRGGKKELSEAAAKRRVDLANRSGMPMQEVENFILEFVNMKKMMQKNLKGIDIDNMSDPNTPVETLQGKKLKEKESKKIKPSRGGGGGFGAKSS
jgi:signal recognition particle subunit SRP54